MSCRRRWALRPRCTVPYPAWLRASPEWTICGRVASLPEFRAQESDRARQTTCSCVLCLRTPRHRRPAAVRRCGGLPAPGPARRGPAFSGVSIAMRPVAVLLDEARPPVRPVPAAVRRLPRAAAGNHSRRGSAAARSGAAAACRCCCSKRGCSAQMSLMSPAMRRVMASFSPWQRPARRPWRRCSAGDGRSPGAPCGMSQFAEHLVPQQRGEQEAGRHRLARLDALVGIAQRQHDEALAHAAVPESRRAAAAGRDAGPRRAGGGCTPRRGRTSAA